MRREIYIAQAKWRFPCVHSSNEASELMKYGAAHAWTLPKSYWLVACAEHSCCSGAGYNAVVIRDSSGKVFVNRTISVCGGTNSIGMYAGIPEDKPTTAPAKT